MSPAPAICVRGVEVAFGEHRVLRGLDLDVRAGEIIGVIGPSGEGKSVLLRAILGLTPCTAEVIEILGQNRLGLRGQPLRELQRQIGVMFQDGALFSNLTVRENISAPLREHAGGSNALHARLADVKLQLAGLPVAAGDKLPSDLSGGMRKRVALARALALDPAVLFLDEPTAGLDPISAARFDALVRTLTDALGLTVFLVTHDLDTLHAVCDRIAVLKGGVVADLGTLAEVQARAQGWIAEYFGGPRARAAGHGLEG
jgi:phospholipid/cholesterol/gamma-HCH transport system ATP-binding protein